MNAADSGKTQSTFEKFNYVLNGRLWIWEAAGNMVHTHPLVGVGPGAFDSAYPNYAHRADDPLRVADAQGKHAYHAHQMYLGIAAENGLIGLGGLLACIVLVARWFRRASPPARDRATPYLACLAVIAFPINSQPVLFSGWWFPIVLLLLCGFLAALEEQTPSHTPGAE
jgi:O-antigen ligase